MKHDISHAYGATAPEGLEWQEGKTAGSIAFVKDAEQTLRSLSTGPVRLDALRSLVNAVKAGKVAVVDDLDPQDFLVFP